MHLLHLFADSQNTKKEEVEFGRWRVCAVCCFWLRCENSVLSSGGREVITEVHISSKNLGWCLGYVTC